MKSPPPRGLAVIVAALSIIGPFTVDTYLPAFPAMALGLGATPVQMQQTLSFYLAPFAFMMLWYGALADALGRRSVLLAALAVYVAASFFCAMSGSIEMLLFGRALQGLSAGAGMVVGRAVVRDVLDGAAAHRLIAQAGMMFAVGPVVAPLVGGWILAFLGWHAIFIFLALYGMALFAAIWFLLPETLAPEHRQSLHPVQLARAYWQVFSHRRFLALAFALSFNFGGFVLYVMAAPTFLMKHLGVSPQGFLWLFGPAMVGMVGGNYISSRLAGKVSHGRTIGAGYLVMAIGAVSNVVLNYFVPPSLPWAVLPLAIYVFGLAVGMASLSLCILDLFPERRGLASSCQGAMQTGMNAAVASLLVPLVWDSTLSMALTMFVLLVIGAFAYSFRWSGGRTSRGQG